MLTLVLVGDLKGRFDERAWYREVQKDWGAWFPKLCSRSRFNRRRRALGGPLDQLRRWLLWRSGSLASPFRVADSSPVVLAHWARAKRNQNRRFRPRWLKDPDSGRSIEVEPGLGAIGHCESKAMSYFGMKLHWTVELSGLPIVWLLAPADRDDRLLLPELLEADPLAQAGGSLHGLADKGYVSRALQEEVALMGHHLWALPRRNQKEQWPERFRYRVRKVRKAIEDVTSYAKRFLELENPKAATLSGLMARLASRLTVLAFWLLGPVASWVALGLL